MLAEATSLVPDPVSVITKYGWPGLVAVQLVIMVAAARWVGAKLISALENNTAGFTMVSAGQAKMLELMQDMRDAMQACKRKD